MTREQIVEFLENLPAPKGYDWHVGNFPAYEIVCANGGVAFYGEYSTDEGVVQIYLIGRHELAEALV